MCRQLVSIGACKHHRFTGLYEKCLEAISNEGICSGAIDAKELFDRAHIVLDEHINLCEPCEFFYNQGLLRAKDAIDLQGHESLQAKREAEEKGKKMRAEELKFLVLKVAREKEEARIAAEEEAIRAAKKKRKADILDGKVAPYTAKGLIKMVRRQDRRPTKNKAGAHFGDSPAYIAGSRFHATRKTGHTGNLPTFGAGVREVGDSEMEDVQLQETQKIVPLEEAREIAEMEEIGAQEFQKSVKKGKAAAAMDAEEVYGAIEGIEDIEKDEGHVPVPRIPDFAVHFPIY